MKRRRVEDKGLIESVKQLPCAACGRYGVDADHVKTRGAGGDDVLNSMMPLCREDHVKRHQMGLLWLSNKYEGVRSWLAQNGWEFDPVLYRWVSPNKTEHP